MFAPDFFRRITRTRKSMLDDLSLKLKSALDKNKQQEIYSPPNRELVPKPGNKFFDSDNMFGDCFIQEKERVKNE